MKRQRKFKINIPGCLSVYKVDRKYQPGPFFTSKLFNINDVVCVDSLNELTELLKTKCILYKDAAYKDIEFSEPKVRMRNIVYKIKCIKDECTLSKSLLPPIELEFELEISEIYTLLIDFRTMN